MSALLQSLAAGFSGHRACRAQLDAVLRDGLPGPRDEAWKYTSLRALERRRFEPARARPLPDAELLAAIPAPRLVFINGHFDHSQSKPGPLPPGVRLSPMHESERPTPSTERLDDADIFARLSAALANDGLLLQVDEGIQAPDPIHLVSIGVAADGDADHAWHLYHRIQIGAGASATLVEHHLHTQPHAHLANTLAHITVAAGGELHHLRRQDEAGRATAFLHTGVALAEGAHYRRLDLELGGGLERHHMHIRLDGAGARLRANGVMLGAGRRHLDTHLDITHAATDTSCRLHWRGIAADRSRLVFRGGITIAPGADGAAAELSNKNLLLDNAAEIDAQPVLQIHADEVEATHGATIGRLDQTALFYLRSRGLPAAQAQQLLIGAFCREPTDIVENTSIRNLFDTSIVNALGRLHP